MQWLTALYIHQPLRHPWEIRGGVSLAPYGKQAGQVWKLNDSPKFTQKLEEELRVEPTRFCFLCNQPTDPHREAQCDPRLALRKPSPLATPGQHPWSGCWGERRRHLSHSVPHLRKRKHF